MSLWIKARLSFLWRAMWRPRWRIFILLWVALGTWDLLAAQLLPPEWANKSPRVYDALAVMSGWLPLWGWALIGMALITGVSIEYAFRTGSAAPAAQQEPDDPYIPLKEAATIAYEETQGTRAAIIAEGLNRDDILGYYAYALFKGFALYGKHPPSRRLEPVPKEEYVRSGFSDDYSSLRRYGKDQNLYEDLQIRRSDLLRRITELKDLGAPLSRKERAQQISRIYRDSVAERNHVFLQKVATAASEDRMNDLQNRLIEEMRELAPERTINLETINVFNELDHPLCNLQDPTRAMVFSEVLLRVKKILEDYE